LAISSEVVASSSTPRGRLIDRLPSGRGDLHPHRPPVRPFPLAVRQVLADQPVAHPARGRRHDAKCLRQVAPDRGAAAGNRDGCDRDRRPGTPPAPDGSAARQLPGRHQFRRRGGSVRRIGGGADRAGMRAADRDAVAGRMPVPGPYRGDRRPGAAAPRRHRRLPAPDLGPGTGNLPPGTAIELLADAGGLLQGWFLLTSARRPGPPGSSSWSPSPWPARPAPHYPGSSTPGTPGKHCPPPPARIRCGWDCSPRTRE
jgi:hypothetical protein